MYSVVYIHIGSSELNLRYKSDENFNIRIKRRTPAIYNLEQLESAVGMYVFIRTGG